MLQTTYELPELDYAENALEPHIDAQTMNIHRTKHHNTYLTKLKELDIFDPNVPIETLLTKYPDHAGMQNHGGGYYNHCYFWKMLSPSSSKTPDGELAEAIDKKWGSFDAFKKEFGEKAAGQFGSGWAWLVKNKQTSELSIIQRANQNHPDVGNSTPILGIDVWEHAYYLEYQNKRPDYIAAFWNVINWDFCKEQFAVKE